jgi:hypothetical protein
MAPATPVNLRTIIGANLRELRGDKTQEQLAQSVSFFGLRWTRATIAALETGRRDLSKIEELVLATVLGRPLTELYDSHGKDVQLQLTTRFAWAMPADSWSKLIRGEPVAGANAQRTFTEAEQKAAAKLGIKPASVSLLAGELWGRSLTEERDRRLAESGVGGDKRAHAGHITRGLLDELRAYTNNRRRKK